jgi:2-keto-4-pentenoate hydratase/2-oxohepta-3-ene-1,7-dioic acid hydratase in catechol pathway
MRLMVGHVAETQSVYLVKGDEAFNLTEVMPEIGQDLATLAGDAELQSRAAALTELGAGIAVASVIPSLPIERPGTIICLGLNYVEHIKEGGYDIPDYPALFMRGANSIMAAGAPLVRPTCSELMIIIGKGGRHIAQEDAHDHIFGYTVFNDGSVRDYQRKTHQWTPGKNFDNTGAIGPFVVTPDEVPEGAKGLKIESRVGDEILQSSNTANMIWSAAHAIAIISEYTTLEPGDHIALGTPPGVGHAKKPNPRWLIPGEVVDIEIEGIGICSSPIVDEAALK